MNSDRIGKTIREIRNRRRLSQLEVSKLANLSPVTVSEVESGKKSPTYLTLRKMANVLKAKIIFAAIEDKVQ